MKKYILNNALAGLLMLSAAGSANAASLSATGYFQDFDSMASTTTLPTDWSIWKVGNDHSTWTTAITANGATHSVSAMTSAGTTLVSALLDTAITSSTRNANAYNIAHAATSADRVLATSPTGIDGNAIQLSLTNNTSISLNSFNLSYDIVTFFGGKANGSPTVEELPGYQLFYSVNSGSWVNVSDLNPVKVADGIHPVVPVGTVGSLSYSETSIIDTIALSSAWGTGQTLKLRWVDDNAEHLSPDQIIGLNNVNVAPVPVPAAAWLLGSGLLTLLGARKRKEGKKELI
jgi:hypothetical protein